MLHYLQGLSYREMAMVLDEPSGTVKWRTSEALKCLRTCWVRRFPIMQPQRRPNSDRSPESLEARLRALPAPPVPSDLEARILAAIPPQISRATWPGANTASTSFAVGHPSAQRAAACLLAVRLGQNPMSPRRLAL